MAKLDWALLDRLELTNANWASLEEGYGYSIAPDLRESLIQETWLYSIKAFTEVHGPPFSDATKAVRTIKQSLVGVLKELARGPGKADAFRFARGLLDHRLRQTSLGKSDIASKGGALWALAENVRTCVEACEELQEELAVSDRAVQVGDAWDEWVTKISILLHNAGLPVGVRKDEYPDKTSPFVELIQRLQRIAVPKTCQFHTVSRTALSVAIHRALQSSGSERRAAERSN